MSRILMLLAIGIACMSAPALAGESVQDLRVCVQRALSEVPRCVRRTGTLNLDRCRSAAARALVGCVNEYDPDELHLEDPVRQKILFDACLRVSNEHSREARAWDCRHIFPPVEKAK